MLKLREIREEKGLSQKEIGQILGVKQQAVSKYEVGMRVLNQNQITKLCLVLEVTPGELLGFQEEYEKYSNYLNNIKKEAE